MPLLLCPNDNGPMQTVQRSGVAFDICPTCRGIWLDRGELEKLLDAARDDGSHERSGTDRPERAAFVSRSAPARERARDWDDDDGRPPLTKRRSSIFDIFD